MSFTKLVPRRPRIADPVRLFADYMRLTGTPSLAPETGDPQLSGKTLGLVNGSSWVSLWGTWFGRKILPGVKLVQAGGDHVQLGFMAAHAAGKPCPPRENIRSFVRTAKEMVTFQRVDAVLITCSTMNRAAGAVRRALAPSGIPVVQIDEAMMEMAVARGGRILVVATHGPTVASTQALLQETAAKLKRDVSFVGATVEQAFEDLGRGDILRHNRVIARAIRAAQRRGRIDTVVLAQLSMSVFALEHPRAAREFGVPVLTSGECGFKRVRELLRGPV
ncbi:MAG: aspartate/glutamate racemase family protein [Opitutaceae bacterium]|nr:aspartate/glutamate racemase family protein [Opitutaceae bacterium]